MSTASAGFVVGVVGSPDPETSPPKSRFRKPIAGDSATPDDIAALGGISSPGTEARTLPQGARHATRRGPGAFASDPLPLARSGTRRRYGLRPKSTVVVWPVAGTVMVRR